MCLSAGFLYSMTFFINRFNKTGITFNEIRMDWYMLPLVDRKFNPSKSFNITIKSQSLAPDSENLVFYIINSMIIAFACDYWHFLLFLHNFSGILGKSEQKHFKDHPTAITIQLFVAIKGNSFGLFLNKS